MTGLVSEREAFERNGEEGKRELTTSHDCSLRVDSQRIFRLTRWHPNQRAPEKPPKFPTHYMSATIDM